MPSFDVVSRLDFQEIDNAIGNALREIGTRYDFKGSNTSIEHNEKQVTVITDDDLKLRQVHDLIITHLVRRKVDSLCLKEYIKEKASGNKVRQVFTLLEGIEQAIAKKITADIKSSYVIKHDAITLIVRTRPEFTEAYTKQTSSLHLPAKPGIIT